MCHSRDQSGSRSRIMQWILGIGEWQQRSSQNTKCTPSNQQFIILWRKLIELKVLGADILKRLVKPFKTLSRKVLNENLRWQRPIGAVHIFVYLASVSSKRAWSIDRYAKQVNHNRQKSRSSGQLPKVAPNICYEHPEAYGREIVVFPEMYYFHYFANTLLMILQNHSCLTMYN